MSLERQVIELTRDLNKLKQAFEGQAKPEVGRIVDWTPTVDQGEAIGITVNYARYITIYNIVILLAQITVSSITAPSGDISVAGIPAAIQPTQTNASGLFPIGWSSIGDVGTATYHGVVCPISASTLKFRQATTGFVGSNPSFSLAVSDVIAFGAVYERV